MEFTYQILIADHLSVRIIISPFGNISMRTGDPMLWDEGKKTGFGFGLLDGVDDPMEENNVSLLVSVFLNSPIKT